MKPSKKKIIDREREREREMEREIFWNDNLKSKKSTVEILRC